MTRNGWSPGLVLREEGASAIVEVIRRELHRRDSAIPPALEAHVVELLARIERSASRTAVRPPWVDRARDMIHARFREHGLRVAHLAAAVGVHPVHLARIFRDEYGATPGEYLRRVRIEWAAEMLIDTALSLTVIADTAGFADQSHFTRAFRRAFGTTPAAWRMERCAPMRRLA